MKSLVTSIPSVRAVGLAVCFLISLILNTSAKPRFHGPVTPPGFEDVLIKTYLLELNVLDFSLPDTLFNLVRTVALTPPVNVSLRSNSAVCKLVTLIVLAAPVPPTPDMFITEPAGKTLVIAPEPTAVCAFWNVVIDEVLTEDITKVFP